MKKILIISTIWGHKSIAKGIYDVLSSSGKDVKLEIINVDSFSLNSYKIFYKYVPSLFKTSFKLAGYKTITNLANKYFEINYLSKLKKIIKKHEPNIVIGCYFAFNSSIEKMSKKYNFRYINAVSDPRTFTRINIAENSMNMIFDKKAINKAHYYTSSEKLIITGWFVEKKYYEDISKSDARKIINSKRDSLIFCISGGSEGTFDILKVLTSFVKSKREIEILFMCGKNKQLFQLVSGLKEIFSKYKNIVIKPYGYTEEMNIYMKASDMVIGKAGPNTIFESVATKTTFFAISHISGQEDGNLEIIKEYGLGIVEEDPTRINKALNEIVKNPKSLDNFKRSICDMSKYNQRLSKNILKLIQ